MKPTNLPSPAGATPFKLPPVFARRFSARSSTAEQTILLNFLEHFLFEKPSNLGCFWLAKRTVLGRLVEFKHLEQRVLVVLLLRCGLWSRAPALAITGLCRCVLCVKFADLGSHQCIECWWLVFWAWWAIFWERRRPQRIIVKTGCGLGFSIVRSLVR